LARARQASQSEVSCRSCRKGKSRARNPAPLRTRSVSSRGIWACQGALEWVFSQKPEFNTGYLLGKVYLLIHQESKARTLFNEMAKQFGDTPQIHLFFGRAYSESDHPDEAIAEFRRAMEEDERAPDIHYYLGLPYMGHKEYG